MVYNYMVTRLSRPYSPRTTLPFLPGIIDLEHCWGGGNWQLQQRIPPALLLTGPHAPPGRSRSGRAHRSSRRSGHGARGSPLGGGRAVLRCWYNCGTIQFALVPRVRRCQLPPPGLAATDWEHALSTLHTIMHTSCFADGRVVGWRWRPPLHHIPERPQPAMRRSPSLPYVYRFHP